MLDESCGEVTRRAVQNGWCDHLNPPQRGGQPKLRWHRANGWALAGRRVGDGDPSAAGRHLPRVWMGCHLEGRF